MNTTLSRAIPAAAIALFAGVASAQVEVVYASTSHSSGARTVVPGLGGQTFKNFGAPYHSPSTARWIVVATTNAADAGADQALLVGQDLSATVVALEGTYADQFASLYRFGVLTNPAVADDGSWIASVYTTSISTSGNHLITGTLVPAGTTVPQTVAAQQGGAAAEGGTYGALFNCPNLTALGPSFQATVLNTPYPSAGYINGVPVVKVNISVPTNQGGATTFVLGGIDRDFFLTDKTGTHWLVKGTLTTTTGPRVLVYDGAVVAEVGFAFAGLPGTVATIAGAYMDPSGDWYAFGTNTGSLSWAVKNGVKVALTGEPIHAGASETWATVQDVKGNAHGDYVVLGTSNAAAPNEQVMVVNNKAVIVRKSDGVDLDGDHVNDAGHFLHTASVGRMTPNDDGYLYYATQMKANATDTTATLSSNNSLVRLPMCPADIGIQGGLYGTDGLFDNNDFVVFISLFFSENPRADIGKQGGIAGRDLIFDNNDFVVFIDLFFTSCR